MIENVVIKRRRFRKKRGDERKYNYPVSTSSVSSSDSDDDKQFRWKRLAGFNTINIWMRKLYGQVSMFRMIVVFRLCSLLFCQSEFVPDEFHQSSEVAHKIVFGYGHLTWEWLTGIRCYIFPLLHSISYFVLKILNLDFAFLVLHAPRALATLTSGVGEWYFYKYCCRKYGNIVAKWIMTIELTCWFTFYCASRPITNSTEMALNMIAFYLLEKEMMELFTAVVAFNFLIRPTAVVLWIPAVLKILRGVLRSKSTFFTCFITGVLMLALGILIDTYFYGKVVISWYNFLSFNVIEGKSSEFGTHPFLWYFYSAIPSILGLNVIYVLYYFINPKSLASWEHFMYALSYTIVFSFIGHKEIRFLLPAMPSLFCVIGEQTYLIMDKDSKERSNFRKNPLKRVLLCLFTVSLASNLFSIAFFSFFHQVGVKPATNYVSQASSTMKASKVWIMMPCYSIPVYTYMHMEHVEFEYFTCMPPHLNLEMPNVENEFSELDIEEFIFKKLTVDPQLPNHVIIFDTALHQTLSALQGLGLNYKRCASFFHSFIGDGKLVDVLCFMR